MATFQEIGTYLDKLYTDGKVDLMRKIVEDLINPRINEKQPELKWNKCSPKVNYQCVQLRKENVWSIKQWLLDEGNFDEVDIKDTGLHTEYGDIKWTDWIVQEPGNAIVFYDNEFFKQNFLVILLKNDEV